MARTEFNSETAESSRDKVSEKAPMEAIQGLDQQTERVKQQIEYQKQTDRPAGRATLDFGVLELTDGEGKEIAARQQTGDGAPVGDNQGERRDKLAELLVTRMERGGREGQQEAVRMLQALTPEERGELARRMQDIHAQHYREAESKKETIPKIQFKISGDDLQDIKISEGGKTRDIYDTPAERRERTIKDVAKKLAASVRDEAPESARAKLEGALHGLSSEDRIDIARQLETENGDVRVSYGFNEAGEYDVLDITTRGKDSAGRDSAVDIYDTAKEAHDREIKQLAREIWIGAINGHKEGTEDGYYDDEASVAHGKTVRKGGLHQLSPEDRVKVAKLLEEMSRKNEARGKGYSKLAIKYSADGKDVEDILCVDVNGERKDVYDPPDDGQSRRRWQLPDGTTIHERHDGSIDAEGSFPVKDSNGRLLGTFSQMHQTPDGTVILKRSGYDYEGSGGIEGLAYLVIAPDGKAKAFNRDGYELDSYKQIRQDMEDSREARRRQREADKDPWITPEGAAEKGLNEGLKAGLGRYAPRLARGLSFAGLLLEPTQLGTGDEITEEEHMWDRYHEENKPRGGEFDRIFGRSR